MNWPTQPGCKTRKTGKLRIIVADDCYFSLEAMRIIFRKLGLSKQCKFVANGQQVTECYQTILSESNYNTKDITIILIDFEMPILSGLEAIKVIKDQVNSVNLSLAMRQRLTTMTLQTNSNGRERPKKQLPYPKFIMCTAYRNNEFQEFVKERGVDFIINKPVMATEIETVIREYILKGVEEIIVQDVSDDSEVSDEY